MKEQYAHSKELETPGVEKKYIFYIVLPTTLINKDVTVLLSDVFKKTENLSIDGIEFKLKCSVMCRVRKDRNINVVSVYEVLCTTYCNNMVFVFQNLNDTVEIIRYLCIQKFNKDKYNNITPLDIHYLKKYISSTGKILPRPKQIKVAQYRYIGRCIKNARLLCIMPFIKIR